MKLIGNSSYGKAITNKERHRTVKVGNFMDASKCVQDINFRDAVPISDDCYEIEMAKKTITENLPIQIGLFVYQYAKLRMLDFYYSFLVKYLDLCDFQMCQMDTDSAYVALAGNSIEALVKQDMREEFERDKCNWLPRDDTQEHARYDKQTPGLFKVEWVGDGIIGLCSKTYYCFKDGDGDKYSCKGINKRQNDISKQLYLDVLQKGEAASRTNRGFIIKNNVVFTYNQMRKGFSYFYPKRKVLEDGVSTTYLDI
ncbi:uncharacterized protein [Diadema setosum]|uniref:uncharacterized protein n=1 Tax=Diadema setosum TaxID=31175 RepID=UPI003B3AFEFC